MWEAQLLVQSAVHPDTGDIVARPFRMAGYIPFNVPILVGLLVPQGAVLNLNKFFFTNFFFDNIGRHRK